MNVQFALSSIIAKYTFTVQNYVNVSCPISKYQSRHSPYKPTCECPMSNIKLTLQSCLLIFPLECYVRLVSYMLFCPYFKRKGSLSGLVRRTVDISLVSLLSPAQLYIEKGVYFLVCVKSTFNRTDQLCTVKYTLGVQFVKTVESPSQFSSFICHYLLLLLLYIVLLVCTYFSNGKTHILLVTDVDTHISISPGQQMLSPFYQTLALNLDSYLTLHKKCVNDKCGHPCIQISSKF